MLSQCLQDLFHELNQEIEYVVLRGYMTDDEIENGKDIDLFVSSSFKEKFRKHMNKLGWHTPRINTNLFPHEQYYYLTPNKLYKVDVVYGLYYGDELLHYKYEAELMQNRVMQHNVYVPSDLDALTTLLLHLFYDKKDISTQNKKRFSDLYQRCSAELNWSEWKLKEVTRIVMSYIDSGDGTDLLSVINNYKATLDENIVEMPFWGGLFHRTSLRLKGFVRTRIMKMRKATIAIIGVDGTGKSSAIDILSRALQHRGFSVYMGYRDFGTKIESSTGSSIKSVITIYLAMWKRYLKYRYHYGGIIIFDRYPYEIYINSTGIKSRIYRVFYQVLFPTPNEIVYIHCKSETSLSRKDDIENENVFRKMKDRFDEEYLNNNEIICLSSDELSSVEIVDRICREINEFYFEFLA